MRKYFADEVNYISVLFHIALVVFFILFAFFEVYTQFSFFSNMTSMFPIQARPSLEVAIIAVTLGPVLFIALVFMLHKELIVPRRKVSFNEDLTISVPGEGLILGSIIPIFNPKNSYFVASTTRIGMHKSTEYKFFFTKDNVLSARRANPGEIQTGGLFIKKPLNQIYVSTPKNAVCIEFRTPLAWSGPGSTANVPAQYIDKMPEFVKQLKGMLVNNAPISKIFVSVKEPEKFILELKK